MHRKVEPRVDKSKFTLRQNASNRRPSPFWSLIWGFFRSPHPSRLGHREVRPPTQPHPLLNVICERRPPDFDLHFHQSAHIKLS